MESFMNKVTRKKIKHKKILNERGSALIGFVLLASVASAYYITNTTGLIRDISKQKSKSEYDYYTTTLTHGVFNYTVNAIKERWCMNTNWGRDIECKGPEMKDIVLNKMNLERFLWSKVAAGDIEQRYKTKYGVAIPEPSTLLNLKHTINIEALESLGLSHPLNLILNNKKLKNCLESITVEIDKPKASQFVPLGDETSLNITVTNNLKTSLLGNCDYIKRKSVLKGLVLFFPRTLNQFSLIKAGDMDLTQFFSDPTAPGITFHSPVYLEKNLILANAAYSSVIFKDILRLGGGSIKFKDNSLYSPKSAGIHKDMLQSHYENFGGLFGGVGLEGEVDEGLSALYGGTYTYPENSVIAECVQRKSLKDNPSLTKNSRLMIRSTGGTSFELGLSLANEFRGTTPLDANGGHYITSTKSTKYLHNEIITKLTVNHTQRTLGAKPVLAITSHLGHETFSGSTKNNYPSRMSDEENFFYKSTMGRNSTIELQLSDTGFLQTQLNALDPDGDGVVDIEKFKQDQMGNDSKITDIPELYDELIPLCKDLKDEKWWLPECNITHKKHGQNPKYDCADELEIKSSPSAPPSPLIPNTVSDIDNSDYTDYYKSGSRTDYKNCENAQASASSKHTEYITAESVFKNELNDFKDSPPKVEIKTSDVLSNKLGFELNILNESNLNSIFAQNIKKVHMRLTALDFMTEGSSDSDRGKRYSRGHLPGPNHTDTNNIAQPNTIYLDTATKTFRYLDNNQLLNSRITANTNSKNPKGWSVIKAEDDGGGWRNKPEPPIDTIDGEEFVLIPEDGLTTAQAVENDTLCDQDVDPLQFTEWDISFTPTTQFSWLYNVTSLGITISNPTDIERRPFYEFPKETSSEMKPGSRLPSYSIVKDCIINSDIDFVLGLFACDNLIIKPRSSKLNIVGTFVVKNLDIDSSALGAGVNFYSLWHPEAIKILEAKKWLQRDSNGAPSKLCSSITIPGWTKNLTAQMIQDFNSCSPMKFIYSGANNFNWSTIDPEIGIDPAGTGTTTQSKVVNRYRRYQTSVVWRREYGSL